MFLRSIWIDKATAAAAAAAAMINTKRKSLLRNDKKILRCKAGKQKFISLRNGFFRCNKFSQQGKGYEFLVPRYTAAPPTE
jgi:hypothetical protein